MLAPDEKVQFRLSTGSVTVLHMIAAGGDVQLLIAAEHWLNVVSGGLPATALAVGGQEFSLRELDVAMFQMVKLDVAVLGKTVFVGERAVRARRWRYLRRVVKWW